ncbi:hypothetical protein IWX50DRAFT_618339 [Phyllosticta citricarpa]|uniref:Uncharacterized protein n=1 Tax=Phyllosticta citricarpa TaxID=55181 RepID=A0ABR1LYF8_9PEZI
MLFADFTHQPVVGIWFIFRAGMSGGQAAQHPIGCDARDCFGRTLVRVWSFSEVPGGCLGQRENRRHRAAAVQRLESPQLRIIAGASWSASGGAIASDDVPRPGLHPVEVKPPDGRNFLTTRVRPLPTKPLLMLPHYPDATVAGQHIQLGSNSTREERRALTLRSVDSGKRAHDKASVTKQKLALTWCQTGWYMWRRYLAVNKMP